MSSQLEETVQKEQSEFEKAQTEKRRQNVEDTPPERELEQEGTDAEPGADDSADDAEERDRERGAEAGHSSAGADAAEGEVADAGDGDPEDAADAGGQGDQVAKPTGRSLFDATLYEAEPLSLPKVDGEGVDKIGVGFGGFVWLDRGTEPDVALIKKPKLGSTVTLMVECEVGPPVPRYTTNRDGALDSLALTRQFKVKHVYKPTAEEL